MGYFGFVFGGALVVFVSVHLSGFSEAFCAGFNTAAFRVMIFLAMGPGGVVTTSEGWDLGTH